MPRDERYQPDALSRCEWKEPDDWEGWKHGPRALALWHQCGPWYIGGPAEVRQLIADLQSHLDWLDGKGEAANGQA